MRTALFLSNQPGISANELGMKQYVLEHTPFGHAGARLPQHQRGHQMIGAAYFQAIGKCCTSTNC